MGTSFFRSKTLADLQAGSQKFSDMIATGYASYGLTLPMATEYATLNDNFSNYYFLAKADATRTKATVQARNDAKILLVEKASQLAKLIDGTGSVSNETKIELGLSVRATPAPMGAPGTCNGFKVELFADGSIEMTWKANNPTGMSGVTYQVWRRFGSEGEFAYRGGTGEKKFVDSTIPVGTAQVQYQIRGIRPTGAGAWAQYNVNFGESTSGPVTASGVETTVSPKLAA